MEKETAIKKILILAANPKDTSRLRLDQELRDIEEGLQRSQKRDQFTLKQQLAVRPRDIQRALLDFNPQIIHFSGHGTEERLIFEDDSGKSKLVSGDALAGLFELFADRIECVVLNGCYSEVQAQAIGKHINYVIGMSQAIGDKAAIEFAVGFYDALGAGRSIEFAYELGCRAIRMAGIEEHLTPVLLKQKSDSVSRLLKIKRQLLRRFPWYSFRTLILISMWVTFITIALRLFGFLQASELWFFDNMMQLQLIEEQDTRLLIVEITKKDIEDQKGIRQGSLTDDTLLQLLKKLQQYQPRTIGLDIYRDFPTQNSDLSKLLQNNPLIISVCNVGYTTQNNQQGVKPAPEISRNRLGFSDFLPDNEGIVRRQILSMDTNEHSPCWSSKPDNKPVNTSFSLELARHYLNKPYEEPSQDVNRNPPLKSTAFKPLYYGSNQGGYSIWTDFDGYQVLLNYRRSCSEKDKNNCSPEFIAKRVTLGDILKTKFLERYPLTDKIVLIGVTDYSYEAPWSTPFSSGGEQQIPGVIIQAQMVSQILSAVSGDRPLLKVWSLWNEIPWIFAWSLVGGILPQLYHSKRSLIVFGIIAFTSLYIICLVFFISPIKRWIPFVPPAFTLLSTGGTIIFIKFQAQTYN